MHTTLEGTSPYLPIIPTAAPAHPIDGKPADVTSHSNWDVDHQTVEAPHRSGATAARPPTTERGSRTL
jgi:hypothetical protein